MIKLNLGSHNKIVGDDYINIDILELENVDAICDLSDTPFKLTIKKSTKFGEEWDLFEDQLSGRTPFEIETGFVDTIKMGEVLEHISFKNTRQVLIELRRILKPGGTLFIQVPDCGSAMRYWVNNQVCECVPHKSVVKDQRIAFRANPSCSKCQGKAKINPMRWLYSFTGAQKHEYDTHKAIFSKDMLKYELKAAGFTSYTFMDHTFKLQVKIVR